MYVYVRVQQLYTTAVNLFCMWMMCLFAYDDINVRSLCWSG